MGSGVKAVVEVLEEEGVELITSFPGSSVLSLYNEILNSGRELFLLKHEADAAFAADGFIRDSRKKAVVISSAGPGSTNLITGLANAKGDFVPLVAISVTAPSALGADEFQVVDIVEAARPIVKKVYAVENIYMIKRVLHEAFCDAWTHPLGPVLVSIPSQILKESSDNIIESGICPIPQFHVPASALDAAISLLRKSERPVMLVGKGAMLRGDLVRKIAEKFSIPIATTIHGAGVIPEDSDLSLGFFRKIRSSCLK